MRLVNELRKGRVVGKIPAELSDDEKVKKAIMLWLQIKKAPLVGKLSYSLISNTVEIKDLMKNPFSARDSKNEYGYQKYHYQCKVKFKTHKEYNPQPDGTWGSHRFVTFSGLISFEDSDDPQWNNIQDVSIKHHDIKEV